MGDVQMNDFGSTKVGYEKAELAVKRVPVTKPPFELRDLKKAIPPHCFERSLVRSFLGLFRDFVIVGALYFFANNLIPMLPKPLSYVAWPVYWYLQGAYFLGLWIMGHECGHQAFSDYEWLNDSIGFILHSFLVTPYYSFKYSHRTHHANCNSIEYETSWIPRRKSDKLYSETLNNPAGTAFRILLNFTIGFPLYFVLNLYGREYKKGFASHVYPYSPIFNDSERFQIFLSDLGLVGAWYLVYHIASIKGAQWVMNIYGVPIIVMCSFFILITYLHHTHPALPHYDSTEWNWLQGALSTVDRDFGPILDHAFHQVTRNHTLHHLFPTIPHYHNSEATNAVKHILGDYRKYDETPVLKAIWREFRECVYAEPEKDVNGNKKGIYWYYR
ncbi:fatty acid desaturase [Artemisia annua]|uniref:Fatty acid desaturase n=1 Tax=Artemisia annua TaxID=35608 RepID=A0A2U1P3N5_ARTAN|nr:fatty acid desaturase [Artemisia annua]